MGGRGAGRLWSGGGYSGGGNEGGRGMSKRGSAAKRGGSRFLSTEDEERLRANVVRRNSLREDGSEMDATEVLVETVGENVGNESVADRVRRLEEGQGGQAAQAVPQIEQMVVIEEARRDEFDFGRRMTVISDQLRRSVGSIVEKISGQGQDGESIRTATVEGLRVMVEATEAVMNGMSDVVQQERVVSERVEAEIKTRVTIVENRAKEVEDRMEVLKRARDRQVWKESVQSMTDKIALGDR